MVDRQRSIQDASKGGTVRVRQGLAAICTTLIITVVTGAPAIADDVVTPVDGGTSETTTQPVEAAPEPAPLPDHVVVQDVQIESIQVGVANTGDNVSTTDTPSPPASATPATELGTGAAAAVGSRDTTAIGQRVVTDLQDQATADIVQISIVFNIGAAMADSGDNSLASGPSAGGDGSIATGSAAAIGNSADTYVTQGAKAQAASGENDQVRQLSATLQIGLSMANSGGNVISATLTTGGPATARTGDATAIGNLSSTAIDQVVSASGRGSAAIHIEQRATVVNLGIAFAGTGDNQIGSDFSAALMRGDQDALEQLLELLLPALFASADAVNGPGAGAISTGDATAIGNRSTTKVLQMAVGEADSGSVDIRQDVTVVNAGAASATTGTNMIGAGAGNQRSALAPEARQVVTQLTDFVRTMLADIGLWASGSSSGSEFGSRGLKTAFGDYDIGIDRSVVASTARGSASAVTTRQLAAVINLAVARANSGGNRSSVAVDEAGLAEAFTDPSVVTALEASGAGAVLVTGMDRPLVIVTGDASAKNTGLVVVCQRADFQELTCLRPPTGETPPPASEPPAVTPPSATPTPSTPAAQAAPAKSAAVPQSVAARSLPATGSDPTRLILAAFALLLFGSSLMVVSRRET
jgi:hypothetical protein